MDHVEITKTEDISEGNMKAFIVSGKDILVSEYQGKYYAIDKYSHERRTGSGKN